MPKPNTLTMDDVKKAIGIAARIVGLATERQPEVVLEEFAGHEMRMYEIAMIYVECGRVRLRGIG